MRRDSKRLTAKLVEKKVELRRARGRVPHGAALLRNGDGKADQAVLGPFALSSESLALAPGNPLRLMQAAESPAEASQFALWFDQQGNVLCALSRKGKSLRSGS